MVNMPEVASQEPSSMNSLDTDAYPDPKASHEKQNGHREPEPVRSYASAARNYALNPPPPPPPKPKVTKAAPANPAAAALPQSSLPTTGKQRARFGAGSAGAARHNAANNRPQLNGQTSQTNGVKGPEIAAAPAPLEKAEIKEKVEKVAAVPADAPPAPSVAPVVPVSNPAPAPLPPVMSFASVARNGIVAAAIASGPAKKPMVKNAPSGGESKPAQQSSRPSTPGVTISDKEPPKFSGDDNSLPQRRRFGRTTSSVDQPDATVEAKEQSESAKIGEVVPAPAAVVATRGVAVASQEAETPVSQKLPEKPDPTVTAPKISTATVASAVLPPAEATVPVASSATSAGVRSEPAVSPRPPSSPLTVNAPEFIPMSLQRPPKSCSPALSITLPDPAVPASAADPSSNSGFTMHAVQSIPSDKKEDWSHPPQVERRASQDARHSHQMPHQQDQRRPNHPSSGGFGAQGMPIYGNGNGVRSNANQQYFPAPQPAGAAITTQSGPLFINPALFPFYAPAQEGSAQQNGHNGYAGQNEYEGLQTPPCIVSPIPAVVKSYYFPSAVTGFLIGKNGSNFKDLQAQLHVDISLNEDDAGLLQQGYSVIHIQGLDYNVDRCVAMIRTQLQQFKGETLQLFAAFQPPALHPDVPTLEVPINAPMCPAFITSVENQGVIYFQLPGQPSFTKLSPTEKYLDIFCSNPDTPFIDSRLSPITAGCIVAAPVLEDHGERWIRARVVSAPDRAGIVQLRSLDYGWLFSTSSTSLKPLFPEFCIVPAQAVEARVVYGRHDPSRPALDQINRNLDGRRLMNQRVGVQAVAQQEKLWPLVQLYVMNQQE